MVLQLVLGFVVLVVDLVVAVPLVVVLVDNHSLVVDYDEAADYGHAEQSDDGDDDEEARAVQDREAECEHHEAVDCRPLHCDLDRDPCLDPSSHGLSAPYPAHDLSRDLALSPSADYAVATVNLYAAVDVVVGHLSYS